MPAAIVAIASAVAAESVGVAVITAVAGPTVISASVATAVGTGVIAGTVTAARGGKPKDVLQAAVLGGLGSYAGSYMGDVVGAQVAEATGSRVAEVISTNVARNVTNAVITGRDVNTAALTGVAAGIPLALNNIDGFRELPDFARNAITNATVAAVTGQDVNTALVASAVQSANILSRAINSNDATRSFFADPNNKAAATVVTNAFNYGMSAVIQGRDVPKALEQSLARSLTQIVSSKAGDEIRASTSRAQEAYRAAQSQEEALVAAADREAQAVNAFNQLNNPLRERFDRQKTLVDEYTALKAEWQKMVDDGDVEGANAFVSKVNSAAEAANVAVNDLNTYYDKNKSAIDQARTNYETANRDVLAVKANYDTSVAALRDTSAALEEQTNQFQEMARAETAKAVDPFETTMEEARSFAAKYNLDANQIDDLAKLTVGFTPELQARQALAEYKQSVMDMDPQYASAAERAYTYAISQGRSEQDAKEFADNYARTTLQRERETTGEKPVLSIEGPEPMFAGQPGAEEFFATPGTRLASLDEVMADQQSGGGKTFYDANANAWVTAVAPELGSLAGKGTLTPQDLAEYQGIDGSYRIPNPDGSYHKYGQNGVYMGVYTGNDAFVSYRPEDAPVEVKPDFSDFPVQNFGGGEEANLGSFNESVRRIMEERGGFPMGWQQVGSDRIFVYDDGTAIGVNENGDPYSLGADEVTRMINSGLLNTEASGYPFRNVPGTTANIPTFKPVNLPGGTPSFRPPTQTSPDQALSTSPLQSATEKAQGSTLGKIPGSWLGGLGRPAAFIDPLSVTELAIPGQEESEDMFTTSPLAAVAPRREEEMVLSPEVNYYSYGYEPSFSSVIQPYKNPAVPPTMYASGGGVMSSPLMAASGGDVPHKGSHYVQGAGGGQDDLIDAKLADGEYVFDAEIVSALGDGSNKRGAEILDKWRENIRKHKRSASIKGIPPKAKSPLEYMKGIK